MHGESVPTFGVEEEFLLVDSRTGIPLMKNLDVADRARQRGLTLDLELTPCQIETTTSILESSDDLRDELSRSRAITTTAAHEIGGSVLAAGVPPLHSDSGPVTDTKRYRRIAAEYGIIANEQGVCGAHVHVGVRDRRRAITISNFVRPWLPILLALTANSAIYDGSDTGYASWRSVLWSRWPSAGPPPFLHSESHYDELLGQLRDVGAILDDGMVYWDVRPSENFPTLEVRVSDVPATVDDTVLLAVLVRALVMTASREIDNGTRAPEVAEHELRWAYWRAARDGLSSGLVDPATGRLATAARAVDSLVTYVSNALNVSGERGLVDQSVARNLLYGNGANRQRSAYDKAGSVKGAIALLTERP